VSIPTSNAEDAEWQAEWPGLFRWCIWRPGCSISIFTDTRTVVVRAVLYLRNRLFCHSDRCSVFSSTFPPFLSTFQMKSFSIDWVTFILVFVACEQCWFDSIDCSRMQIEQHNFNNPYPIANNPTLTLTLTLTLTFIHLFWTWNLLNVGENIIPLHNMSFPS